MAVWGRRWGGGGDGDDLMVSRSGGNLEATGQFHIGEHLKLMAKNNLQNSLKLLVLMYR